MKNKTRPYCLEMMGKQKIEFMYYDSHTTIKKYFLKTT